MHELFRDIPPTFFALMVGIPVIMTMTALVVGWMARAAALRRRKAGEPRQLGEDALAAAITVAVVPFGFALLMIWARFG